MRLTDFAREQVPGPKLKSSTQGSLVPAGGPELSNAPDIVLHTLSPTTSDVYTGEPDTAERTTFSNKSKIECHFSGAAEVQKFSTLVT